MQWMLMWCNRQCRGVEFQPSSRAWGGHNQEFCFTTVGLVLKIIKLEYVSSGYRRTAIYYILTLASYFSPYLNIC